MPIHSFEIISVPASDAQRAKHAYRDGLGFALIGDPVRLQGASVNTDDIDGAFTATRPRSGHRRDQAGTLGSACHVQRP